MLQHLRQGGKGILLFQKSDRLQRLRIGAGRFAEVCGVKVPLQSVRLWREYYRLMGRDGKVEMIDAAARS